MSAPITTNVLRSIAVSVDRVAGKAQELAGELDAIGERAKRAQGIAVAVDPLLEDVGDGALPPFHLSFGPFANGVPKGIAAVYLDIEERRIEQLVMGNVLVQIDARDPLMATPGRPPVLLFFDSVVYAKRSLAKRPHDDGLYPDTPDGRVTWLIRNGIYLTMPERQEIVDEHVRWVEASRAIKLAAKQKAKYRREHYPDAARVSVERKAWCAADDCDGPDSQHLVGSCSG